MQWSNYDNFILLICGRKFRPQMRARQIRTPASASALRTTFGRGIRGGLTTEYTEHTENGSIVLSPIDSKVEIFGLRAN